MSQTIPANTFTETAPPQSEKPQDPSPPKTNKASSPRLLHIGQGTLPPLIVFAAIAGIGVYGHRNHWQLPAFSKVTGQDTTVAKNWCEEHGVPESQCVVCNPELMPPTPDYGWCTEHGVHNCTLHHPNIAQSQQPPRLSSDDVIRAEEALAIRNRTTNNAACKVYQQPIQFASEDAIHQAGVDVELIDRGMISEWVSGNGEIRYDATRFARISSRSSGTASQVLKNLGDRVTAGEVIAVVDAMEVGQLKGELVKAIVAQELARKNSARITDLAGGVIPQKEKLEAEAELAQAEANVLTAEQALANLGLTIELGVYTSMPKPEIIKRLRFAGFPKELVDKLSKQTQSSNLIPVFSPLDGVIVQRSVVAGERVNANGTMFEIADPRQMWLMLNIPLEDALLLKLGQTVEISPDGTSTSVQGTLDWISTAADKQTRMVQVRASLKNPTGHLKDETFGTGRVLLRSSPDAVLVPKNAVHWEGCCQVAFVRDANFFQSEGSPKLFHVRSVRTGATNGDNVEVIAGLLPGEVVATKGSDVLRAQLLKNNLGAGCCAE